MARPKNIENTIEPRFDKLTIPFYNKDGVLSIETVHKPDVTKDHIRRVLAFWDDLKTKDPSFNKESAIVSVFKSVGEDADVLADNGAVSETAKNSRKRSLKISTEKDEVSQSEPTDNVAEVGVSSEEVAVSENVGTLAGETEEVKTEETKVSE